MSDVVEELIELSSNNEASLEVYKRFVEDHKSTDDIIILMKGLIKQKLGNGLSSLITCTGPFDNVAICEILDKSEYGKLLDILYDYHQDHRDFAMEGLFTITRIFDKDNVVEIDENMMKHIMDKYSSDYLLELYEQISRVNPNIRSFESSG